MGFETKAILALAIVGGAFYLYKRFAPANLPDVKDTLNNLEIPSVITTPSMVYIPNGAAAQSKLISTASTSSSVSPLFNWATDQTGQIGWQSNTGGNTTYFWTQSDANNFNWAQKTLLALGVNPRMVLG